MSEAATNLPTSSALTEEPRRASAPSKVTFKEIGFAESANGGGALVPKNFAEIIAFSEMMARAQHAIPKHLRDNPGACMAVTMQALRWEMDPFAVAAKSYSVNDQIAYEAQLIAAVVNTRAAIVGAPDYEFSGEGPERRCKVSAVLRDGTIREYESPRFAAITPKNSPLWKTDPDQQLGYYAIRAFARRYCPEVLLGVYDREELPQERGPDTARDVTPARSRLAEKLAAGRPATTGFSAANVRSEIDGGAEPEAPAEEREPSGADSAQASEVGSESDRGKAPPTLAADGSEPPNDDFPGDRPPLEDAVALAFRAGQEAKARGANKRALPAEYREDGRDAEKTAWLAGLEGEAA